MLKKVIPIILSLCLALSIGVMAENTANENAPDASFERKMPENFDPSQMPAGNFDPSKMPPEGFDPSQMPQGGFDPSKMPENFDPSQIPSGEMNLPEENAGKTEGTAPADESVSSSDEKEKNPQNNTMPQFGGQMPQGMGGFQGNMQAAETEQEKGFVGFVKTYTTPIISVVLLILAYLFVIFYKRKHY